MKNAILSLVILSFVACKQTQKTEKETILVEETPKVSKTYPENILKIFEAHGGLETWNNMKLLEFSMPKPEGTDVITVNLKNRKSLLDMPNHTIGYNGKEVWLKNKGNAEYKSNPRFFYNLMFYFYAMPFVLADDGIVYGQAEPLMFEGKTYPGIKIEYNDGVGESSDDIYVLYYDSETYKMAWLGYTVTYFSEDKNAEQELHFRKYNNWQDVNGLLLPQTIERYNYEANNPTTVHSIDTFTNVKLSEQKPDNTIFETPEGAQVVK